MRTDDIDGASPNAYGKVRHIQGRDYMQIQDIKGAKPRYIEQEELREKLVRARQNSILDVSDINQFDRRSKRL